MSTKIGIVGYGNLGKACEKIAFEREDMEVVAIFTRRDPKSMSSPFNTIFQRQEDLEFFKGKIDVLLLCTGSANDLTYLGLRAAKTFNTVDSFDTHARMREYVTEMQKTAFSSDHLSFVGIGWDPGLFSLMRALFGAVLTFGNTQTFWGKGVSQGHSEAIRKIEGVEKGIQYTVPKQEALDAARDGRGEALTTRDKHFRECFVVAAENANKAEIERQIKIMPNYFADYDTVVHFISSEEFDLNHKAMPHGGIVMRSGEVNDKHQGLEFKLNLESNPDFTGAVLTTYARTCHKLFSEGQRGAKTILDIPVAAVCSEEWLDLIGKVI